MAARIRKGDTVIVISGKDKGKKGEVLRVLPERDAAIVSGINKVKRHVRPSQQNPNGGIVEIEHPIHLSKIMPVDPVTGKPTRIRFRINEDGKKVRIAVKSNTEIG
ncbi:MAG: 50S ribosomal protein L24 [Sandaracinaceae bacterium]|nr:50S ribosomal protein L24 [Sandaracinaceae bacterium]